MCICIHVCALGCELCSICMQSLFYLHTHKAPWCMRGGTGITAVSCEQNAHRDAHEPGAPVHALRTARGLGHADIPPPRAVEYPNINTRGMALACRYAHAPSCVGVQWGRMPAITPASNPKSLAHGSYLFLKCYHIMTYACHIMTHVSCQSSHLVERFRIVI